MKLPPLHARASLTYSLGPASHGLSRSTSDSLRLVDERCGALIQLYGLLSCLHSYSCRVSVGSGTCGSPANGVPLRAAGLGSLTARLEHLHHRLSYEGGSGADEPTRRPCDALGGPSASLQPARARPAAHGAQRAGRGARLAVVPSAGGGAAGVHGLSWRCCSTCHKARVVNSLEGQWGGASRYCQSGRHALQG